MAQNHLGSTSSFTDRRAKSHNRRRSSVSLSLGAGALTADQARSSSQHLAPQPLSPIPGTYLRRMRRDACAPASHVTSPLCVLSLWEPRALARSHHRLVRGISCAPRPSGRCAGDLEGEETETKIMPSDTRDCGRPSSPPFTEERLLEEQTR